MDGGAYRSAPAVLYKKTVGSGGERRGAFMFVHTHHDDADIMVTIAQAARGFDASHALHLRIQKDKLRLVLLRHRQGLQAVAGFPADLNGASSLHCLAQTLAHHGVFVRNQNRDRLHRILFHSSRQCILGKSIGIALHTLLLSLRWEILSLRAASVFACENPQFYDCGYPQCREGYRTYPSKGRSRAKRPLDRSEERRV